MNRFHWRCPSCGSPLELTNKTWGCENNHRFDQAKEGYVNLLLVQNKKSKDPGDNKAMVAARRTFLREGHYQPLVDAMANTLQQHVADLPQEPLHIFDAGCGEGYYLEHLAALLSKHGPIQGLSGVDISKPAVQKAAKSMPNAHFSVASTFDIPLMDSTQDVVVQVFAPVSASEVYRVLKPGGVWLTVSPAAGHLFELKQKVYDKPEQHQVDTQIPEYFYLLQSSTLNFPLHLSSPQMREALLMMTPFYWQIPAQKKDALIASLSHVNTDFHIRLLRKGGA